MSVRPRRAAAQKLVEQETEIDSTTETNGKGKGATKKKPVKIVKEIDPLAGGDDEPQKTKTKGAKKEITNGEDEKPVPVKKGRGKKEVSVEAENGDEPKTNKKGKKKEEVVESVEEEEETEIEPEVIPAKKGKKNAKSVEEKEEKESSPTKKKKVEKVEEVVVEKPKRGRGAPPKSYTETVDEKPVPAKGAKGKKKVPEPMEEDEDKIEAAEPEKATVKSKGRPKRAVSEDKEVIEAPKAKGGRSKKAASVEPESKFFLNFLYFFKFFFLFTININKLFSC